MSRYSDLIYKRREGSCDMNGELYEVDLCMLFWLKGTENGKVGDFCLASNMAKTGEFDDIIFKYHYQVDSGLEKSKLIFLQAKHKKTTKKEKNIISMKMLLEQLNKGDFSLRKYLSSYVRIMNLFSTAHPVFNTNLNDCEFILYTNAEFNINKCKDRVVKKNIEQDHVLYIHGQSNTNNDYYQLIENEKIMNILKQSLDYKVFVHELSQVILSRTLDMKKSIFNYYHYPLKENVIVRINEKEGKFRDEFLNNTDFIDSIKEKIQNDDLRNYLENVTIKLSEEFDKLDDNLEVSLPCKIFSEEVIKTFLQKFKLFASQPNEKELEEILQNEIKSICNLDSDDTAVYSDVKEKIQNWWRRGRNYITKDNTFLKESAKVGFLFDIRPPSTLFTGREKELMALHNKMHRDQETVTVISQMVSISGLGGIGKTELARKYIHKFIKDYHNIIWINAESKETLCEGFVRFAKENLKMNIVCLDGTYKCIRSIVDEVYRFFSKRRCLFIFDNALNHEDFTEFLPLRLLNAFEQKPFILITSRDREWSNEIGVIELLEMNLEDATELTKKGLNIKNNNQDKLIAELIETLQYFPLAILQCVAYIMNQDQTRYYNISNYLEDYKKNKKKLLETKLLHLITNNYAKTTFTTWNITINAITKQQTGDLALEILSIMAYIAPDNIHRYMFLSLSQNEYDIISAIRLLIKYSMINGEKKQTVLNIHRLVQEVIRIEKNDQDQEVTYIQRTFSLLQRVKMNISLENMYETLLPHFEAFIIHVKNWIPQNQNETKLKFEYKNQLKNWLYRNLEYAQMYGILLTMLVLLRGMENKNISNFYLAANKEEITEFNDTIFRYYYADESGEEKSKIIFMQAKHQEIDTKITLDTLLSQSPTGDFVLRKYLSSYIKIEYRLSQLRFHPLFNKNLEDEEYIVYTNTQFISNDCANHVMKVKLELDHILHTHGQLNENYNYYYKLRGTKEIINALRPSLDFEILVKELSQMILIKRLYLNKSIIRNYHFELKETVIERINNNQGIFSKQFLEKYPEYINGIFEEIRNKKSNFKCVTDLKNYLDKTVINLPKEFGNIKKGGLQLPLPNKLITDEEIRIFLHRLKLFVAQPNETRLEKILQNEIRSIYNLEPYDNDVFFDVKGKILNWWRSGFSYLTKENKFFQESAKVCIFFYIKPPTNLFSGREEEIMELYNKISQSGETQMTIVTGLGGIGKTELARRFVDQFSKNYDSNIIWINAENKVILTDEFLKLAHEKLRINTQADNGKEKSVESIIDGVYQFFSKRKCLFVFDNAVNCEDLTKFLPFRSLKQSDQKPYILITSRDQEWDKCIQIMNLSVLNLNDAIKLFKRGLNIQNNNQDEEIEKLIKEFQCFPLAIRQAIAYIKNENIIKVYNVYDYLRDYETHTKQLLNFTAYDSIDNYYSKTTFATWKPTLYKIDVEQQGPLALEILSIMSYIAPENISRHMFWHLSDDRDKIISAVRLLVKYSMINGEHQQYVLSVHKLVQEVIRNELSYHDRQDNYIQKTFDLFYKIFSFKFNGKFLTIPDLKQMLVHLEVFLGHVESWTPRASSLSFIPSSLNIWKENRKQMKAKEKYLEQLFNLLNSLNIQYNSTEDIVVLNNKSELEEILSEPHISYIAHIILNLGNKYGSIGEHQKQKELLQKAVEMFENYYGPEDISTVFPLECLSNVYEFLKDYEKTIILLEQILKINKTVYGVAHVKTLATLKQLVVAYNSLGDFQKREEFFDRVSKWNCRIDKINVKKF